MIIGILEPYEFSKIALKKLESIGSLKFFDNKTNLHNFISDLNVLFVRLNYKIDKNLLFHANSLEFICSPTTGISHIDLNYLNQSNIKLINLTGELDFLSKINATPEHTFGLIISLLRNYGKVFQFPSRGAWDRDMFKGRELSKLRIGIIGFGRVGLKVAKICKAFSARIGWFDIKNISADLEFTKFTTIDELIIQSDIIVLCANYYNGQLPILGYDEFIKMKGKYFINTARGELVDEDMLYKLASTGFFAGVAIDVIKNEQKSNSVWYRWKKLRKFFNVIVTPHIAGCTYESMSETEIFVVDKLIKQLNDFKRV